ncbi:hypothetical protein F5888DRAFT_1636715 [Russula emetica]|nr:hypothetical protein F5888DRAFT_1636715 [Russula emetica]
MVPPTIATPATILSGGVSVGGEECEGGGPSGVKWCDGASSSGSVIARSDPESCGDGGIPRPLTLNLKGEREVSTFATALEEMMVSPPVATLATVEGTEMVVSLLSTFATPLEVVSPMTLDLKMPTHAMQRRWKDSPKMPTRPTKTNAAEVPGIIAETSAHPLLRPSHRSSEDKVENEKDERNSSNYPIPVHLWDVGDVEYILNGQGNSKVYGNQSGENRRKVHIAN